MRKTSFETFRQSHFRFAQMHRIKVLLPDSTYAERPLCLNVCARALLYIVYVL